MPKGRRRWHRVADSTWDEPWDNDVFAFLGRLQGYLNSRWATEGLDPDEAGRVRIHPSLLCRLTGCQRVTKAAAIAGRAAVAVTLTIDRHDGYFDLEWKKFSVFQRYQGEIAPVLRANEGESEDSPAPAPEEEKIKSKRSASRPEGVVPKQVKPSPPEALRCAEHLLAANRHRTPGFESSKWERWANEIRLLHERDGVSWDDIDGAIEHYRTTEIGYVIQSGASLRRKFQSLLATNANEHRPRVSKVERKEDERRARERAIVESYMDEEDEESQSDGRRSSGPDGKSLRSRAGGRRDPTVRGALRSIFD